MIRLVRLFGTSVGQKLVVAITGAILLLFVFAHMLGNMAVFQGIDSINAYAAWLQGHPLVWFMRLGLLVVFSVHVVTTLRLAIANRGARATGYQRSMVRTASFTSRYMVITGLLIFAFVIYHLLHFTFGVIQPENFGLNTGTAPTSKMASQVATKVNPCVITSSPGPTPRAARATFRAAVPEVTAWA